MEARAHAAAAYRLTKLDLADRGFDTGPHAAAPHMSPQLVIIYVISPAYIELHPWSSTSTHGLHSRGRTRPTQTPVGTSGTLQEKRGKLHTHSCGTHNRV